MARRESSFRLRPKRTFSLSLTFNRSLLSRESRTVRITRFDESRQSYMRAAPSAAEVRQFRRGRSKAPKAKAHRRASPPRGSSSSCRTAHLRCSPRARATRARLEHARSALMVPPPSPILHLTASCACTCLGEPDTAFALRLYFECRTLPRVA